MYEKFEKLLKEKNVTPYRVHKETGISTATLSDWKNGKSQPKKDKIEKICEYFGVPVSYFYEENVGNENQYYINDETARVAQEIFENKELRALFDVQRGMSAEDLQALHGMALALKRKERGGNDDTGC